MLSTDMCLDLTGSRLKSGQETQCSANWASSGSRKGEAGRGTTWLCVYGCFVEWHRPQLQFRMQAEGPASRELVGDVGAAGRSCMPGGNHECQGVVGSDKGDLERVKGKKRAV